MFESAINVSQTISCLSGVVRVDSLQQPLCSVIPYGNARACFVQFPPDSLIETRQAFEPLLDVVRLPKKQTMPIRFFESSEIAWFSTIYRRITVWCHNSFLICCLP
jgi:hypothetical protein